MNWAFSWTGYNLKGMPNSIKAWSFKMEGCMTQNKNREGQAGGKAKPGDSVKSLGFPFSKLQKKMLQGRCQTKEVRN